MGGRDAASVGAARAGKFFLRAENELAAGRAGARRRNRFPDLRAAGAQRDALHLARAAGLEPAAKAGAIALQKSRRRRLHFALALRADADGSRGRVGGHTRSEICTAGFIGIRSTASAKGRDRTASIRRCACSILMRSPRWVAKVPGSCSIARGSGAAIATSRRRPGTIS